MSRLKGGLKSHHHSNPTSLSLVDNRVDNRRHGGPGVVRRLVDNRDMARFGWRRLVDNNRHGPVPGVVRRLVDNRVDNRRHGPVLRSGAQTGGQQGGGGSMSPTTQLPPAEPLGR
ncbi:MAG: hypothetical protein MZV70_08270 [Desulfobacterales bacterium]|nr:hypothetical protein [Desulfobacterales bacterium]